MLHVYMLIMFLCLLFSFLELLQLLKEGEPKQDNIWSPLIFYQFNNLNSFLHISRSVQIQPFFGGKFVRPECQNVWKEPSGFRRHWRWQFAKKIDWHNWWRQFIEEIIWFLIRISYFKMEFDCFSVTGCEHHKSE